MWILLQYYVNLQFARSKMMQRTDIIPPTVPMAHNECSISHGSKRERGQLF